jgi:acyl carrier protein
VLVREDNAHDKRLVAYAVPNQRVIPSTTELMSFLRTKLPGYMVPSALVFLEALPMTPNGKVDRKALPIPDQTRLETGEGSELPRTPMEVILATIWNEVLKIERVGIRDNFFDLGGHSLLATQVMSRIRKVLHVEISLRSLFEKPTVEELSAEILRIVSANSEPTAVAKWASGKIAPGS